MQRLWVHVHGRFVSVCVRKVEGRMDVRNAATTGLGEAEENLFES